MVLPELPRVDAEEEQAAYKAKIKPKAAVPTLSRLDIKINARGC